MVFTRWNKFRSFTEKKQQIFCLFHAFYLSGYSFIKNQKLFSVIPRGLPLPHSNVLQYYVKREKCKVNDIIFPSGCEARAFKLGNKNVKIGIFTGRTSVRSKNIFTDISWYSTGKHEIRTYLLQQSFEMLTCVITAYRRTTWRCVCLTLYQIIKWDIWGITVYQVITWTYERWQSII